MDITTKEGMLSFVENKMKLLGYMLKEEKPIEYGKQLVFFGCNEKEILRIYWGKKGTKLDLSLAKSPQVREALAFASPAPEEKTTAKKLSLPPVAYPFAGSDEAGKGDYFGPLCVACVFLDETGAKTLEDMGVKDSKKLTDKKMLTLSSEIKKNALAWSVSFITPQKLNLLHKKMGNLNHILAFLHACAIKDVMKKKAPLRFVLDQFGREEYMEKALSGEDISLFQTPKAEGYTPVAAASILARTKYLEQMQTQSESCQISFPMGAGEKVIECAREFCAKYSLQELSNVAKTFFKTTDSL